MQEGAGDQRKGKSKITKYHHKADPVVDKEHEKSNTRTGNVTLSKSQQKKTQIKTCESVVGVY